MPLVKAMQEQHDIIAEQKAEIRQLQMENEQFRDVLAQMNQRLTDIENQESEQHITLNGTHKLFQNEPNPFTKTTQIRYELAPGNHEAMIQITNMAGQIIERIELGHEKKGNIYLEAQSLPAGSYQYTLIVNGHSVETRKLILQ